MFFEADSAISLQLEIKHHLECGECGEQNKNYHLCNAPRLHSEYNKQTACGKNCGIYKKTLVSALPCFLKRIFYLLIHTFDCIRLAISVFFISIAIVIGPTPPGTGVM